MREPKAQLLLTLTAGLSHEIRNPLNSAALQLALLERRISKLPPKHVRELAGPLKLAQEELLRLNHTLEDFLLFARPRELIRRPVSSQLLFQRIQDVLATEAEQRAVQLLAHAAPDVALAGDEHRLRQVFMNLVVNGLEATPPGGRVEMGWTLGPGERVTLFVHDTGPGVPAALQERIFEPFFTTKATGTGLGLALVHAIVTQHDGTVALVPSGFGARFEVQLPRWSSAFA